MNLYKNQILLLSLHLLCFVQLIKATESNKFVQSLSNYPENDLYNYNVMNGSYFDNRLFQNKEEKYNLIAHDFKHMHVQTDINDELLLMLTHSNYSRQQLYRLMHIAQKVAKNQDSQELDLKHLERGYKYLEGDLDESNVENFYNPRITKTAYHEAAHAFVLINTDTGKDLLWSSIQPDNARYGQVFFRTTTKRSTKQQQKNLIDMLLAGGIAEQRLEKLKFKNYKETLIDFLQRGTSSDWSKVKDIATNLGSIQAQKNQTDCLLSSSKTLDKDLTLAEDFFDTYTTCANMHLSKEKIHKYARAIVEERYRATEESVTQAQPIINAIAQELLDKKVVSGKRIKEIVKNEKFGHLLENKNLIFYFS
ncbi:MAG: hypothetical protein ACXWL5_01815 [Candidatus Chromulinivorax sp.]